MKNLYIFTLVLMMFSLISCNKEDVGFREDMAPVCFELFDSGFDGVARSTGFEEGLHLDFVRYYFVRNGQIVEGLNSELNNHQILVDGLQPGKYTLLLLGVKGNYLNDKTVIHELNTPSDVWLEFDESSVANPKQADYFYSSYDFDIQEGVLFNGRVPLIHICGKMNFDTSYAIQYIEASMDDVLVDVKNVNFYSQFKADNTFTGLTQKSITNLSIKKNKEFLFPPTEKGKLFKGSVKLITTDHKGNEAINTWDFMKNAVTSNRKDNIEVLLSNSDKDNGMVYLSSKFLSEKGFGRILQDDESKEVYYDTNQRSFYIDEPVQVKVTEDGKLNLRYYCARPMKGLMVYAKFESVCNEFIEFAYLDELPDFADLSNTIGSIGRNCIFRTEGGRYISLKLTNEMLMNADFKLKSSDGLMDMFNRIPAHWAINFKSYGANPDAEDGGQYGSWIGIRPVHIRSAICILQNVAYMLSFKELHENVRYSEYNLKDDNDVPIVGDDRYEILKKMINMSELRLGLVKPKDGSSSRGLGGGGVMGVDQEGWIGCYSNYGITFRNLPVVIHEIGHNMGYMKHAGCMTDYGPEAYVSSIIFPNFFWKKWESKDIIIDKDYVNATASPYLYRFK